MEIFAHRGYSLKYPENTLASFEAALSVGAKGIELDVVQSLDGKIFVLHDRTLDRTTNAQGIAKNKPWSFLKDLDAGSWFDDKFSDQKLPLLEQVLDLVRDKARLNIEIKKEAVHPKIAKSIEIPLVQMVKSFGLGESVLYSSFSARCIRRLAKLDTDSEIAFLKPHFKPIFLKSLKRRLHFQAIHCAKRYLTENFVQKARLLDLPTRVYTVNDVATARRLKSWGVAGIYTDDIATMVAHLERGGS